METDYAICPFWRPDKRKAPDVFMSGCLFSAQPGRLIVDKRSSVCLHHNTGSKNQTQLQTDKHEPAKCAWQEGKKKEGFPAKWCVWIWQGACWIQRRGGLRCYCRRSWFVKHKRWDCCAGVKRMCAREGRSSSSDVCLCRVQRFHPPVQMLQRLQDSSSARSVIVAIIII